MDLFYLCLTMISFFTNSTIQYTSYIFSTDYVWFSLFFLPNAIRIYSQKFILKFISFIKTVKKTVINPFLL